MPNETVHTVSGGDIVLWTANGGSLFIKAKTSFGDPVELNAEEARELVAVLINLTKEIE